MAWCAQGNNYSTANINKTFNITLMETISGSIREKIEHISGEIKEYCDQEPVLVKDSAGTLLYTKKPAS